MFERFTTLARQSLVEAQVEARSLRHGFIGTEHQLLGLLKLERGIAREVLDTAGVGYDDARVAIVNKTGSGLDAEALATIGIDVEAVRRAVEDSFGPGALERAVAGRRSCFNGLPFTPRAKKVLELALREALALGQNYIGTEHILLGMLREDGGVAVGVLHQLAPNANFKHLVVERLRAAS
jgi:ATP-dependent Clp protease ATP-binding subunit ClpA